MSELSAQDDSKSLHASCGLLTIYEAGIITRVDLCWNFGRLVSETSRGYRDELKTLASYLLGAHVGHNTCKTYVCLRPSEAVFLVILGLLSDPLQARSGRVITAQCSFVQSIKTLTMVPPTHLYAPPAPGSGRSRMHALCHHVATGSQSEPESSERRERLQS